MPIVGHQAYTFWGRGSDDNGFTGSITVNIAPASISAQAGYYEIDGDGVHHIGIKHYRYRPTADGVEKDKDYGDWPNWAHTIGADRVTGVTVGIGLGARQEAH